MIKTRDNYINEQENNSHITKPCYHRTKKDAIVTAVVKGAAKTQEKLGVLTTKEYFYYTRTLIIKH